jgi:ATP-dependent Clp protease adapter protein ClpS
MVAVAQLINSDILVADVDELTKTEEQVEESIDTPWRLFLFDDDIHTFDEVIEQIIKAKGCGYSIAQDLTFQVHNNGKALIHEGEFLDCLKMEGVLKEIQLVTEIRG